MLQAWPLLQDYCRARLVTLHFLTGRITSMETSAPLPSKIVVAIHDLHPWGGQDKSNLEILYHVNKHVPLDLHSFSFVDQRAWPQAQHVAYTPSVRRPVFLKSLFYSLVAAASFKKYGSAKRRRQNQILIQSTGTASPVADVVQVQFIHKTWLGILREFNLPESEHALKNMYYSVQGAYNVLNEDLIYTRDKTYIAISHSIKKELIEHFKIPQNQIHTIYHGVNPDTFYPAAQDPKALEVRRDLRTQLGIKESDIALLHVGALNQRKGLLNSIKTLSYLKKNGITNVVLIAVGAGDKKALLNIAAREGVSDQLKIVTHSKNVRDYYWASDVFFFPSIYEPFGLVILEAMACGLPCLVSGNAGATELITNRENGLVLQNIFEPELMAQDLEPFLKDSSLREKMGQAARETALTRSWEHVADEYLSFYSGYLEGQSSNLKVRG